MTAAAPRSDVILEVRHLVKHFQVGTGLFGGGSGTVKAVDDAGGVEGGARIATVAITAAVDGKTVLARATARVRLPA